MKFEKLRGKKKYEARLRRHIPSAVYSIVNPRVRHGTGLWAACPSSRSSGIDGRNAAIMRSDGLFSPPRTFLLKRPACTLSCLDTLHAAFQGC